MAKYELIADIGTDFVNMSLKNADFVLREPALVLADSMVELRTFPIPSWVKVSFT